MHPYFSSSYSEARTRFLDAASAHPHEHLAIPISSNDHPPGLLNIDLLIFGNPEAERLLVHSSGVHGVEGFVGSAIQLKIVEEGLKLPSNTAVLFIHVVNPFGMASLRRWNEYNVDLNRNFFDQIPQKTPHPLYQKIRRFLVPDEEKLLNGYKRRAASLILKHGYGAIQQVVAQGQYHDPEGIFYGGQEMQQGPKKLIAALKEFAPKSSLIWGLDVHTGLGKFNEHHLYLEGLYGTSELHELERAVGKSIIHVEAKSEDSYAIHGGFIEGMKTFFEDYGHTAWLTEEFGTAGPVNIVKALRKENYYFRKEPGSKKQTQAAKEVLEAFSPRDDSWQKKSFLFGLRSFHKLLIGLNKR